MACENDFDCPLGLVCYEEVRWKEETNFCSCNHYYGWTGENCTDFGGQTYYFITMSVIEMAVTLVFLLLCLIDIFYIVKNKRKIQVNPTVISWIWSTLGLICFLLWKLFETLAALSPDKNTKTFELSLVKSRKFPETVVYDRIFSSFLFIFTCNALLMVSVMWLSIAYRAQKLVIDDSTSLKLKRYKYGNYCFQVVFAIMILSVIFAARYDLVGIMAVPFLAIIAITYTLGRWRLGKVLNTMISPSRRKKGAEANTTVLGATEDTHVESSRSRFAIDVQKENHYKLVARSVRITSTIIISSTYGLILSSLVYSALRNTSPEGQDIFTGPGNFDVSFFFC
mmetsp:Transcript_11867/g.15457  ORF Transcript_11867/g.15457 Transcript_11867/m.15457 type:complete len:339 (-) Transcript_11867:912-1928(-)